MNKILIIEDDESICALMADILERYGKILMAHNAKEAQKCLSQNKVDLVITDYYLGEENGLDIVKDLYTTLGQIPVILISAFPTINMLEDGISLKIHSFLRKPVNFDELIKKVESLLLFDIHFNFCNQKVTMINTTFEMKINDLTTQLTEIQFKMMKYFFENTDKVIEREKMISHIWGSERLNSENTLDTHLLNLKKKVPFLREHLKTLPRIGYLFCSDKKEAS